MSDQKVLAGLIFWILVIIVIAMIGTYWLIVLVFTVVVVLVLAAMEVITRVIRAKRSAKKSASQNRPSLPCESTNDSKKELQDAETLIKMTGDMPYGDPKFDMSREGTMATVIGAGKYIFGVNIPLGQYDLKVISGHGWLEIQNASTDAVYLGTGKDSAKSYTGLTLPKDKAFSLSGDLQVEISKTKMLEID